MNVQRPQNRKHEHVGNGDMIEQVRRGDRRRRTIWRNKLPNRCCSGGRLALLSTPIKNRRWKSASLFKLMKRLWI